MKVKISHNYNPTSLTQQGSTPGTQAANSRSAQGTKIISFNNRQPTAVPGPTLEINIQ